VGGRGFRGDGVDDPLSETGWAQMWRSVGDSTGWDAIVTSPLQRCSAFATALGDRLGRPVSVEPRVREVGMGSWEGRTPQEIIGREPHAYAAFYSDPVNNRPPGCEPLADFGGRVADAYKQIVTGHAGQRVLVVAHAGVIRAALGYVLQSAPACWYRTRIDYAGVSRFRIDRYGHRLEFHNRPGFDD